LAQAKSVDFDPSLEEENEGPEIAEAQESSTPAKTSGASSAGSTVRSCLVELGDNIFNFEGLKLKSSEYKIHTLGTPAQPHNYTLFSTYVSSPNTDAQMSKPWTSQTL
jgi:hypothetical protein